MYLFKGRRYFKIVLINLVLIILASIIAVGYLNSKINENLFNIEEKLIVQIVDYKRFEDRDIVKEIANSRSQKETNEILNELKNNKYNSRVDEKLTSNNIMILLVSTISIFLIMHIINFIYLNRSQKRYINDIDEFINSVADNSFNKHLPEIDQGLISKLNNRFNKLGLTIRKNSQKLEKEHLKMREVLTDISHQVKTPILALSMYNEILLGDENMSEQNKEFLSLSEGQIARLTWLITSILKISRFEANSITLKKEKFEIAALSENFESLLLRQLNVNNLTISHTGNLDAEVELDFNWTSEALLNIVKNATEHAYPNTDININYTVNVAMVKIDVTNQGDNIPSEELNKIFQRFYKSPQNNNPESVGIGLNLSKQIVERQFGTISVQNLDNEIKFSLIFLR